MQHESANVQEGWLCEYVEVYNTRSNHAWLFQCNQWFSLFRTDGLTKRELYPQVLPLTGAHSHLLVLVLYSTTWSSGLWTRGSSVVQVSSALFEETMLQFTCRQCSCTVTVHADYRVVVVTGEDEEAGTDSHVFITLFGKTGASPKLELKKPDGETEPAFQAGSSDEFVVRCNNVGPLKKIRCASFEEFWRPCSCDSSSVLVHLVLRLLLV